MDTCSKCDELVDTDCFPEFYREEYDDALICDSCMDNIDAERLCQSSITHFADDATLARIAELEKDAAALWLALNDLSFHCDGVTCTEAPPRGIYNKAFEVMQSYRAKYSPGAIDAAIQKEKENG